MATTLGPSDDEFDQLIQPITVDTYGDEGHRSSLPSRQRRGPIPVPRRSSAHLSKAHASTSTAISIVDVFGAAYGRWLGAAQQVTRRRAKGAA